MFPKFDAPQNPMTNLFQQYHTIRGEKRHGLIVDPGASSGLMGTDTLLDYITDVINDWGLPPVAMTDTTTEMSGISGTAVKKAYVPFWTPEIGDATWECDLIGGHGSRCPGLMALPTLLKFSSGLLHNVLFYFVSKC